MPPGLTFHLIPHTHWDREWYLPRAAFQARIAAAGIDLAGLLANDPESRFVLDGQTVLVEDLLAIHPQLEEPLAAAVAQGRLEVGPWYILADELIPSGESLIRNLLQGSRDSAHLGRRMDVLYSPDAFGHPAILPTLAAQFGIPFGVVWRGLAPLGGDCDLYRWFAPNGGEVVLYHLPPAGYEVGIGLLDGDRGLAARWRAIRDPLVERAETAHIAVFLGADHHAPPRELARLRQRLATIEPKHRFRISTLSEFFAMVAPQRETLPTVSGELRWSYGHTWTLQGVHATRSRLKRLHASLELDLWRRAEPLSALARLHAGRDQRGMLRSAWRTLLQCQFHDSLCGCCSDLVAAEQHVRLESVRALSEEIARGAMHSLARHDADRVRSGAKLATPTLLLWNPLPRARRGIVTAELTFFRRDVLVGPHRRRKAGTAPTFGPFVFVGRGGMRVPVQVLGAEPAQERIDASRHYPDQDEVDRVFVAFDSETVHGLGISWLRPKPVETHPRGRGLSVSEGLLANRFVGVRVSPTGAIQLEDRSTGRQYRNLLRLEDACDEGDTYTVFLPPGSRSTHAITPVSRRVIVDGPLVGATETLFTLKPATRGRIDGRLVVVLYADSPLVRIRLYIENWAKNHRLRARFTVGGGAEALAGAAFGFERRPPVTAARDAFPMESPALTAPAQRFIAAAGESGGLALLSPGFFEYEWTGRDLLLTLLRSVGELSRADLPTRPGHAGWPIAAPGAQEPGSHCIDFAIAPLGEGRADRPELMERMWEDAFLPVEGRFIRDFCGDVTALRDVGVELFGKGLVFSALKPAESGKGIVLRCYNATDEKVRGVWRFKRPVVRALLARADETHAPAMSLTDPRKVDLMVGPREFSTILVE